MPSRSTKQFDPSSNNLFQQQQQQQKQQQQQLSQRDRDGYPETPLSPRLGPTRSSIEAKRREREEKEKERRASDEPIERGSHRFPASKVAPSQRYGSQDDFPESSDAGYNTFGKSQASLLSGNSPPISPRSRSTITLQSTFNLGQPASSRPGSGGGMAEESAASDRGFPRSEKSKGKARQIDAETSPTFGNTPLTIEDRDFLSASSAALAYSQQADLADQPRKLEDGQPTSSLDPRAHWLGGPESPPQKDDSVRESTSADRDLVPISRHLQELSSESQRTFGEEPGVEGTSSTNRKSRESLPPLRTQAQSPNAIQTVQDDSTVPSQTPTPSSTQETPISTEAPSDNQTPSTPPRTLQTFSSRERQLNPIPSSQYNRNGSRQVSSQAPTISSSQASPARTRTGVGERGGLSEMGGPLQRTLSPDQEQERLNARRRREEIESESKRNIGFNLHRSDTFREGGNAETSRSSISPNDLERKGPKDGEKEQQKSKKPKRRLFGVKRTKSDATSDRTATNLNHQPDQDPKPSIGTLATPQDSRYLSPSLAPLQISTADRIASPSSASPMSSGFLSPSMARTPTDLAYPKRLSSLYSSPAEPDSIPRSRSQSEPLEPEPALLESRRRLSFLEHADGSLRASSPGDPQRRARPSSISFPATFASGNAAGIASKTVSRRSEGAPWTPNAATRDPSDDSLLGSGARRGNSRSGSRGRRISTPGRISQNTPDLYTSPFLSAGTFPSSHQLVASPDNQGNAEVDEAFGLGLGLPIRYSLPVSEDLQLLPFPASGRPSISTLLAHRTKSLAKFHLSSLSSLRPRLPPNPNQVLEPLRFKNSWFARIHHLFLPILIFYHVPATIFLDFNALYTIAQLSVYGNGGQNDQVGWYVALAVYAASDFIWFFAIVVGLDGIRFLTRSWSKGRPYILPIYLSSNAFNLAAIKSYSMYSFLYKVRMRATPKDRWIETCWYWSQNWPTVLTLLPRGIISVAILVLYGPSADDVSPVEGRDSTYFDSEDGYLTNFIFIILLINAGWTAWRLSLVIFSFLGLIGTLGFKAGLSRDRGIGYEKETVELEEEDEMNHQMGYASTAFSNQGSRFPLMRPSQDVEATPRMWVEGHATAGGLAEGNSNPQVGATSRISLSAGGTTQAGTVYPPAFTPIRSRPASGAFKSRSSSPARHWRQRAEDRIREVLFDCMPAQSLDYSLSRINQTLLGRDEREVQTTPRPSDDHGHHSKLTEGSSSVRPPKDPNSTTALTQIAPSRPNIQKGTDAQATTLAGNRNRTQTGDTDLETVGDWNRSRRSRATSSPETSTLEQRLEKPRASSRENLPWAHREETSDVFGSPNQSSVVEMLLSTPVIEKGSSQDMDRSIFTPDSPVTSASVANHPLESHRRQESVNSIASSKKALAYPFPSRSVGSSPRLSAERTSSEERLSSDKERKSSTFQRLSGEFGSKRNSRSLDPNSSVERLTPRASKTHSREVSSGSSAALTAQAEEEPPSNLQALPGPTSESLLKPNNLPSQTQSEKPTSSLTSLASSLKNTITRSSKSSTEEKPSGAADLLLPSQATDAAATSNSSTVPNEPDSDSKKIEEKPSIAERRRRNSGSVVGSSQPESMKLQGSDDWWKSFKGAFVGRSESKPTPNGKPDPAIPSIPSQESRPSAAEMSRASTATQRRRSPSDTADLAGIELENNPSTDSLEAPSRPQNLNLIPPSHSNLNRAGSPSDMEPPSPGGMSAASSAADSANTGSTDDSEERKLWASFPEQSRIHPPGRIVVDLEQKTIAARERERARIDTSSVPIGPSGAMNIVPSRSTLSSSPEPTSPAEFSGGALNPLSMSSELSKSPSEGGLIPIKEESWSSSHGDSLSSKGESPSRSKF